MGMSWARWAPALVAGLLLTVGVDAWASPKDLMKAAKRGKVDKVTELLQAGVDANAADKKRHTALMMASDRGHLEVVELLLEAGANPARVDNKRRTALGLARKNGHGDVVERLRYALVTQGDKIEGYVGFLDEFPASRFANEAKERLHRARWTASREQDDIAGYQEFLSAHPDSEHVAEAKARVETLAWQALQANDKARSEEYQAYVDQYPASANVPAAQDKIAFLKERESRLSIDGRYRVGKPSALSEADAANLLQRVKNLIDPLTLAQLAGDEGPHSAEPDGGGGGIRIGGGGFAMGTSSVERADGTTVMTMSARRGGDPRPSNVGVWYLPPGQSALMTMFGSGNSGKIMLRLYTPSDDASNPLRFNRVRTFEKDTEIDYTYKDGNWEMQRYERSEE